jgi:hypothetical protein
MIIQVERGQGGAGQVFFAELGPNHMAPMQVPSPPFGVPVAIGESIINVDADATREQIQQSILKNLPPGSVYVRSSQRRTGQDRANVKRNSLAI